MIGQAPSFLSPSWCVSALAHAADLKIEDLAAGLAWPKPHASLTDATPSGDPGRHQSCGLSAGPFVYYCFEEWCSPKRLEPVTLWLGIPSPKAYGALALK